MDMAPERRRSRKRAKNQVRRWRRDLRRRVQFVSPISIPISSSDLLIAAAAAMGVESGTNSFSKEMSIRKKIARIYNKREEDFPSLREYNDYLEEVEDLTFNLIEGIDVLATEAKIEKYRKENAEQIINAEARKAEELAAALKAEIKGHSLQTDVADLNAELSIWPKFEIVLMWGKGEIDSCLHELNAVTQKFGPLVAKLTTYA